MKINFSRVSKVFTASLMALIASSVLVAGGVTPATAARAKQAAVDNTTQVKYRTVEIDGQSIFYREAGSPDAPTLLLFDTGHFALEEDGKVIAERIRDFLTVSAKNPKRTRTKKRRVARVTL